MRKILLSLLLLLSTLAFSQVGIGTVTPHVGSVLDLTASDKGVLLPRVANTAAIAAPTNGLLVYDISASCLKSYENGAWSSCLSGDKSASVVVDCNTNAFVGSYNASVAMSASNKFSVTIRNNSFANASLTFATTDLVLSGVSGITVASVSPTTASLTSGQSQLVEYTLTGTPASTGTLTGTWTKSVLNCVKTVPVLLQL